MLVGMASRSLNLLALGWAIAVQANFWVITIFALINAVSRAFYDPVASAVMAAICTPQERVAAFSLQRVGSSVGWAVGPMVATLAGDLPYATLFFVGGPLTFLAAVAAWFIPETRPAGASSAANVHPIKPLGDSALVGHAQDGKKSQSNQPLAARLKALAAFPADKKFARFLWGTVAFYLLQTQMYHILAIYAAKHLALTRGQVATLFMINGVLVVLFQLPAVRYIRKIGNRGALVLGSIGYMLGYGICGLAWGYLTLLPAAMIITLAEIIAMPAQQTAVTAMAPPDQVGRYAGCYGLVQGGAQTLGPMLGSALLAWCPAPIAWLLLASLGLVAANIYRPPEKKTRQHRPPNNQR